MKFLLKNGKIILIVLIILAAYGIVMYIKRIKKEDFITIDYNQKYEEALEEYYDQSLFSNSVNQLPSKLTLKDNTRTQLDNIGFSDKQKYIFLKDSSNNFQNILIKEYLMEQDGVSVSEIFNIYSNNIYQSKINFIEGMLETITSERFYYYQLNLEDKFKLLKIMNTYEPNNDVTLFFIDDTYLSYYGEEEYQVMPEEYDNIIDKIRVDEYYRCQKPDGSDGYDEDECQNYPDNVKYMYENNFKLVLDFLGEIYAPDWNVEEFFKGHLDNLELKDSNTEILVKEEEGDYSGGSDTDFTGSQADQEEQRRAQEESQQLIEQQRYVEEAEEAEKEDVEAKKALEKDGPPKKSLNDVKCNWTPIGDTPFQCVNDCIKSGSTYGCTSQDCVNSCEGCKKPENCRWLYKTDFSEAKRKQPQVGFNDDKCHFKPYGENINQCINECSQRIDKINYGGSNCDRVSCANLCYNCDDEDWCSWKTRKDGPPAATILFGNNTSIGNENQFTLYWDHIDTSNYYIVVSYERDNPDKTLNIKKINNEKNEATGKIEYKVKNIKNNINYNFYILCVNDFGLSLPSNEITLKITQMFTNNIEQSSNLKLDQQNQADICKFRSDQPEISLSNTALDLFKGQKFNLNLR